MSKDDRTMGIHELSQVSSKLLGEEEKEREAEVKPLQKPKKEIGYKPKKFRQTKPPGRPRKQGSLDGGLIRVSHDLKETLEMCRKPGERLNDTIRRLIGDS